jgi:hypothetical protein
VTSGSVARSVPAASICGSIASASDPVGPHAASVSIVASARTPIGMTRAARIPKA